MCAYSTITLIPGFTVCAWRGGRCRWYSYSYLISAEAINSTVIHLKVHCCFKKYIWEVVWWYYMCPLIVLTCCRWVLSSIQFRLTLYRLFACVVSFKLKKLITYLYDTTCMICFSSTSTLYIVCLRYCQLYQKC